MSKVKQKLFLLRLLLDQFAFLFSVSEVKLYVSMFQVGHRM